MLGNGTKRFSSRAEWFQVEIPVPQAGQAEIGGFTLEATKERKKMENAEVEESVLRNPGKSHHSEIRFHSIMIFYTIT